MNVVLLEKIKNLGMLGDIVKVANGYARNFLIPTKKAAFATEENIKKVEQNRIQLEAKAAEVMDEATRQANKINEVTLIINVLASEEGSLYGSVGAAEIETALRDKSIEINKRDIVMPEGLIRTTGDFVVDIRLHSDVTAQLKVQIVPNK